MPTFEQLARDYANRITSAHDHKTQANLVFREIKGLVYKSTGSALSAYDRKELLLLVLKEIINTCIVTKSADNSEYLELIAYIAQLLREA